jgi:hypothetical protein
MCSDSPIRPWSCALSRVSTGSPIRRRRSGCWPRCYAGANSTSLPLQWIGILNAVSEELGKRPHPRSIFRYFAMLPWIGAVADYLGEYGALVRAADAGETWILAQDNEVDEAGSAPDAREAVTDPMV